MAVNALSFIPIQDVSARATELIQAQKAKFARQAENMPPGLRAMHRAQLDLLENPNVPDFEIIFFPFAFPELPPFPNKPYVSIFPTLARPFSRGTIVSVYYHFNLYPRKLTFWSYSTSPVPIQKRLRRLTLITLKRKSTLKLSLRHINLYVVQQKRRHSATSWKKKIYLGKALRQTKKFAVSLP